MVTDLTNSAVAIAVQTLARDKHRVDLVTSTATTALTNKECSPYDAHWTFDAYELSAGTARAVVAEGGRTWFFVTADYTFGANLEGTATREIERSGGKVLGHAWAPLNTGDFASQLLRAQASGAQVIGLANSGADTANSVKPNFPTVTHPTAGMPQKTAGFYGRSRFVVLKITVLSEDIWH